MFTFAKIYVFMKKIFLLLLFTFSFDVYSQNLISVPFNNGFVGDNTANNSASNCYYLTGGSGLGWSNVQFAQNSTSTIFVAQGNDIIGMVLITDNNGVEHTINGFIKWRTPSGGSPTTPVFQPEVGTNVTLATNSLNGSSTYLINETKYIGLTFNGSTLTISPVPGTVTGNAATNGLLDLLNSYLNLLPKISIQDVIVNENDGNVLITVTLSTSSSENVAVNYSTSDNTALSVVDYTSSIGSITFTPGQVSQTISIPIIDDFIPETLENFTITLSDPTNAAILDGSGIVSIVDNDTCTISSPSGSVTAQPTCATTTGTIVFATQSGVEFSINGTTYQASATFTGVAPGNYTLRVRSTTDNSCTATGSTVTVINGICATDDIVGPINGFVESTTIPVLQNDTLNGLAVIPSQITLTGIIVPTGLTLNPSGTITIAANTPAGTYTLTYQICEVSNPTNCSTTTATLTVGTCLSFQINDCDNDGETNGIETTNGTNPNDPCSYTTAPIASSAAYASWSVLDCDGDGTPNGSDTAPNNPCIYAPGAIANTSNPIWAAADCDNDGESNGVETTNGTNPNDPCSYTTAPIASSAAYASWSVLDCDGDGVTNSQEIIDGTDPLNPCQSIPINITLPLSTTFLNGDCDGDGLSNEEEIGLNIQFPNDSNNNGISDYLEVNNSSPSDDDLEIFNAITPNGNGENDVFVIRNIENYPNNSVKIYNRWGVIVYDVDSYGQDNKFFSGISDGRTTINRNEELPIGTYFYVIRYVNLEGVEKQRSGYLFINK